MNTRSYITSLALVLLAAACGSNDATPLPDSARDEAGVYTAVLRHVARRAQRWPDGRWRYLLVADHCNWDAELPAADGSVRTMWPLDEPDDWLTDAMFTLRRDCYEDFGRQELVARPLPELEIDYPLRWQPHVSKAERGEFAWDGFHAEHGGATWFTRLSSVGFDANGTQALVEVTHGSGALSSWSDLVLLGHGPHGWHVVTAYTISVS